MNISLQDELLMLMNKPDASAPNFEQRITDSIDTIEKSVKGNVAINDSYGNSLEAIGNDDKAAPFSNYRLTNDTLNWYLWLALYNDSWVFRRAIDKPAQDEIRAGITINGEFEKDELYRQLQKHRFDLINILRWGALFGGSVGVVMFDTFKDEDYIHPLKENLQKVQSSKAMKIYVTDRWYGVAVQTQDTVSDMTNLDFGKPKSYTITFADGHSMPVHHDYVLRYEHRTAPQLIKTGMLQGWGYAEGAHIINEIARDEKFKGSIQSLVDKALIEVIKMSGMRGVFMGASSENEDVLKKRLEMVNWGRTFNSLTFLDKDDDYQEHGFSGLTGLSDLLEKNMWMIAAALEMQGILFGDLKGGFSNDEKALERYDETIQGRCESYVRPVIEKFLWIVCQMLKIDEKIDFTFNSLQPDDSDKEQMESLKNFTELCDTLMTAGVLDTKLYAKAIQTYITKGVIDFGLTDEVVEGLSDKMAEEMENIDLDGNGDVNEINKTKFI